VVCEGTPGFGFGSCVDGKWVSNSQTEGNQLFSNERCLRADQVETNGLFRMVDGEERVDEEPELSNSWGLFRRPDESCRRTSACSCPLCVICEMNVMAGFQAVE
jgi:hypothetical protein